jgi:hypothetical protein
VSAAVLEHDQGLGDVGEQRRDVVCNLRETKASGSGRSFLAAQA